MQTATSGFRLGDHVIIAIAMALVTPATYAVLGGLVWMSFSFGSAL